MRAGDLDHDRVLSLGSTGGQLRFAGGRALIVDVAALGLLRRSLVANLGLDASRTFLTRLGFAEGWRAAEAMKSAFPWDSDQEWQHAGLRILALEGVYQLEPEDEGSPASPDELRIDASCEAEQHVLHFGRSTAPACWTIAGFLSGYLSRCRGHDVYFIEDACAAQGGACCQLTGLTREEWGPSRPAELASFGRDGPHEGRVAPAVVMREAGLGGESPKVRRGGSPGSTHAFDGATPSGIVAQSASMRQLLDLVVRIAKVDSTILVVGESGSGKERIAKLLHDRSARAGGPFIAVNCGAITESLLESELFGHARGAFTGASRDREGLFEAANGGTLLLDEVGEISPGMQVKLLRVIQEREVRRVGDNRSRRVDVRVIASTNRDLARSVATNAFRQDLYYRLKVVELRLPALRDRPEDILPLARMLLAESAARMGSAVPELVPELVDRLLRYAWPGNVRELANAMERGMALARGDLLRVEDLPDEIRLPTFSSGPAIRLEDVERNHIVAALAKNGGNQARTALELGIGTATLYRKLKQYRAEPKQGAVTQVAGIKR